MTTMAPFPGLEDLYDGVDPLEASGIGDFDIMAYPYVSLVSELPLAIAATLLSIDGQYTDSCCLL